MILVLCAAMCGTASASTVLTFTYSSNQILTTLDNAIIAGGGNPNLFAFYEVLVSPLITSGGYTYSLDSAISPIPTGSDNWLVTTGTSDLSGNSAFDFKFNTANSFAALLAPPSLQIDHAYAGGFPIIGGKTGEHMPGADMLTAQFTVSPSVSLASVYWEVEGKAIVFGDFTATTYVKTAIVGYYELVAPEPATWGGMLAGLSLLGYLMKRRRR